MIDHSLLSPSGRISNAARKRALERTRQELFGEGLAYPTCSQPTEAQALRLKASQWRELAAKGMKPRKYKAMAQSAEEKANKLEEASNAAI